MLELNKTSLLHRFTQNARILVAEGYYDHNFPSNNSPPSLVKALEKSFCIIGEFKKSAPGNSAFFSSYETNYRLKQLSTHCDALSVITEPNYFLGSLEYLHTAAHLGIPLLMKDFIIDTRQIDAAKGVSAILLIDKILSKRRKIDLMKYAHYCDLEVVLEVDNEDDFRLNLESDADILAINNRNLDDLSIDINNVSNIFSKFRDCSKPVLGFSGYKTIDMIFQAKTSGLSGILIGTALSLNSDPGKFVSSIKQYIGEHNVL